MNANFLTLALLGALFFSCSTDDQESRSASPEEIITTPNPQEKTVLQLVNEYRLAGCNCGGNYYPPVAPLVYNSLLEKAALKHSIDMKNNNFFSHTGSDASTVGIRVSAVGYTWRTVGENIANGYTSNASVMQGWINSPGHCVNIMNPAFKEMGVARVGNYWTQNFATKQ